MSTPRFIAVDWGTSNFRAYLADGGGKVLDYVQQARGILAVEDRKFADVLKAGIGGWATDYSPLPIMMSGMIGSRQGWVEAPYVRCPASVEDLARALTVIQADGIGTVHLVAGLDHAPPGGPPDVIRGEEAQAFGAMAMEGTKNGTFVQPGTHSKWINVADGKITGFSTYMTGEVFAALKGHTILGRLMTTEAADGSGFLKGVEAARTEGTPGDLLNRLFSVRTLGLFDRLPARELSDYLSGLLIGSEVIAAARPGEPITIFGSGDLTARYGKAAETLGLSWKSGPADSVVAGQLEIAHAAGLL